MKEENGKYRKFCAAFFCTVSVALVCVAAVNYVVDPFNMNRVFDFGLNKETISFRASYHLYKMLDYGADPCPNVILGDSRGNILDPDIIEEISGRCWYNFTYAGGSMKEIFDTFDYLKGRYPLESIYMVHALDLFADVDPRMHVKIAEQLSESKISYYTSSFVLKVSLRNVMSEIRGKKETANTAPDMTKDEFWEYVLIDNEDGAGSFWNFEYPGGVPARLMKMKEYCEEEGIELVFIIVPMHRDIMELVSRFGLEDEYARFRLDLASISTTIDFNYENEWTSSRDNFRDPVHMDLELSEKLIREVWGDGLRVGRLVSPPGVENGEGE